MLRQRQIRGGEITDLNWLTPDGAEMQDVDWNASSAHVLGVQLNGRMINEVNERGQPIVGNTLLILFNTEGQETAFQLPKLPKREYWIPPARRPSEGFTRLGSRKCTAFGSAVISPWKSTVTRSRSPPGSTICAGSFSPTA